MGGGNETIDTDALRALAGRFDSDGGAHLDAARTKLAAVRPLEYSNFTTVAWTLATAYVEAANFQNRDLETKRQTATSYGAALKKTADDWDSAEAASTPKTGGN
jgi:hypothetical protein